MACRRSRPAPHLPHGVRARTPEVRPSHSPEHCSREETPLIIRPKTHLLLPLLAMSMALGMAALVHAQDRHYQGSDNTSMTLQVTFGTTPHWMGVPGTRVREIRQAERPDYDMFRYGRNYYAYHNNQWYMSRRWRGEFSAIDDRFVPNELSRVPREHWRNYPSGWSDQNGNPRYGRNGQRH